MDSYTIQIRNRRQTTFPLPLLRQLGVEVGDWLEIEVKEKEAIIKPKKRIALDALSEIQRLFKESSIPEEKMQTNLRKIRKNLYDKRYSPRFYRH